MEIVSLIILFAVIGTAIGRITGRLSGYDQWVYQRLYNREKATMPEYMRRHMQEKFNVK